MREIVLDLARDFAREGLATIGISAVSHGRRGNPIDLLGATPFVARDIFRQTIADQMTLLRAIEAGIDLEGDGASTSIRSASATSVSRWARSSARRWSRWRRCCRSRC